MANPKQLKIFNRGAKAWNSWRIGKKIWPDLTNIDLSNREIFDYDFRYTNFSNSNLSNSKFHGSYFGKAYLSETNLTDADFRGCSLWMAHVKDAVLEGTNFTFSNLRGAMFNNSVMHNAIFDAADLLFTDFSNADLTDANFQIAKMPLSKFNNAILTGAKFYGSSRDDWEINCVKCDYIYVDLHAKEKVPPNRNFNSGEFEKLYKSLPTIEYYFSNGFTPIDALLIDKTISEIANSHPEFELELESYQVNGALPKMRMTIKNKQYKEEAYSTLKGRYEELAKEHQAQRKQIADITLALINKAENKTYNIQGDMNLKNKISSDSSNIMIASPNSSQEINNNIDNNIEEIIDLILIRTQEDKSIDKSEYINLQSDIRIIKEHLTDTQANTTVVERALSNLGSVASISSLVSQLAVAIL